jgi:nucleoside-diphosphate-sugar epimerase
MWRMRRVLFVGFGDVAVRTARLLVGRYRLYALTRSAEKAATLREQGVTPLVGDLDQPETLSRLAGLAHMVFHFAPPVNRGLVERRTRSLLTALASGESLPHRLVYISTSGVYGDAAGALVNETYRTNPTTARARRRLDAERWIRCWSARNGVSASILRVPGIYGPQRLPLSRLRQGTATLYDVEDPYTNHIHIDDLARACVLALTRGRANRVYNVSDDTRLKMGEYFDLVADRFSLPRPPRISRSEAAEKIPENLLSFMSESRRLVNARLKRELRVRLRYPDVGDGLAAAVNCPRGETDPR